MSSIDLQKLRRISSEVSNSKKIQLERSRAHEAAERERTKSERELANQERIRDIIQLLPEQMEAAALRGEHGTSVMLVAGVNPNFKRFRGLWNVRPVTEINLQDVIDPVARAVIQYCQNERLSVVVYWNYGPGRTTTFPLWVYWCV